MVIRVLLSGEEPEDNREFDVGTNELKEKSSKMDKNLGTQENSKKLN